MSRAVATQSGMVLEIDDAAVLGLVDRVWEAVSGPSLEAFLRGPGHKYLANEVVARFAYQGDKKTGDWPDLSEATQNIREQQGFGADWPINIRTEEMFHVVTEEADFLMMTNEAEMVMPGQAGKSGLVAKKIQTAQEGSNSNPIDGFGPTPPRPVLAADETDAIALVEVLALWVMESLI